LDVLKTLVESDGELVTKQTLMQAAWPGTIVEEANLTVQIATLRKVLDDGRIAGSCIQTVIGRGYRFQPSVERVTAPIEAKGHPAGESAQAPAVPTGSTATPTWGVCGRHQTSGPKNAPRPNRTTGPSVPARRTRNETGIVSARQGLA
jgi:DNA-binding winged helix-turn-helix (wHTH) protein